MERIDKQGSQDRILEKKHINQMLDYKAESILIGQLYQGYQSGKGGRS